MGRGARVRVPAALRYSVRAVERSMHPTFRLLLLCLTLLSLPVQGLAAAVRLHCAVGHGGGAAQVLTVPADHRQQHGDHGHHGTGMADQAMASHGGHHGPSHDGSPSVAAQACSACAACCIGIGLPSAPLPLPARVRSTTPAAAPTLPPVSFIASGPERPPRPRTA